MRVRVIGNTCIVVTKNNKCKLCIGLGLFFFFQPSLLLSFNFILSQVYNSKHMYM